MNVSSLSLKAHGGVTKHTHTHTHTNNINNNNQQQQQHQTLFKLQYDRQT